MTQSKFKIGDKVKVTSPGHIYTSYSDMAIIMGFTNWDREENELLRGNVGTVINIQKHPTLENVLIGIRIDDGKEYIIDENGLELVVETKSSDVIQISRQLLNDYYNASTYGQKRYINDNFKIDGTTTVGAIIRLEAIACNDWKHTIRKNHPECFPKTEFDFSEYNKKYGSIIFTTGQSKLLGFEYSPIQIINHSKYHNKGFYLSGEVEWKLIKEGSVQVLVPIK
jgi:hypothetical protein